MGRVLYRFQVSRGQYFHWEQPQRSLMMLHPGINEIHQHTQVCQFDMCQAGELKDPNNHQYMKKGMQVLTTHHDLFRCLHGQACKGNHHHQPIEGSVKTPSGTMLRTKYTEIYPRKFARMVAKVLYKARHSWPFQWKQRMSLLAEEGLEQPALVGQSRVIKSRGRQFSQVTA